MSKLTEYDLKRYHRQMLLSGWGEAGQERLKSARVFIVGAGGLGSPAAIYLAAAGVGELHICDSDTLELSNLNRQILHNESRLGWRKADSAQETLSALNSEITVRTSTEHLTEDNIARLVGSADIALDCLDNFPTRYLLNRYCISRGIPLVHGAIWGLSGQVSTLHAPATPCFRCLFPEPPETGVFPVAGVMPGVVGCLQAAEALKVLVGIGSPLQGTLLVIDLEDMEFHRLQVRRRPDCPDCNPSP